MPKNQKFRITIITFNPELHLIDRMGDQQKADRLAALSRAQVNEQNDGQQVRHPNIEDEYLGYDKLLNPSNLRRAEKIATLVQRNANRNHPF